METNAVLESEKDAKLEDRLHVIKVWDAMVKGARHYVNRHGFVGVHNMPELVGITGACENVDTLFKVDFFGQRAYLAQSDQLYLELLTPHLGKVYAEMQSFRAEPDVDPRHLCQFSLFEIEHLGGLNKLQYYVKGVVASAVSRCLDLGIFDRSSEHYNMLHKFAFSEISKITYENAIEELIWMGWNNFKFGDDLKAEHEKALVKRFGPCFVTHYPKEIKFFNMKENDRDSRVVNSCDLLLPYAGESAGAAERETDHDTIVSRLKESDMYKRLIELGGKDEDFAWYLDAHKGKDIPQHSGAGIGLARVAQFILGREDIRDCVPFVINSENLQ